MAGKGLTDSAKSAYDDANDGRQSGMMAFDEMDLPDGHDADVCIPAVHQNPFLDTGLPSHPLMDDEGSQSNDTCQNSRESGTTRDQEKARGDQ